MADIFLHKQYRDAARQHLTVCRRLIDSYPEWGKACNKHDQSKIFHEIYYITGYIIEGFVNYAIFCDPNWDENSNVREISRDSEFSRKTHLLYSGNNPNGYILAAHNFQKNIQILHDRGNVVGIPYLSTDTPLDNDSNKDSRLKRIISKWEPSVRYKKVGDPIELSFEDIRDLIYLCKRISDEIRNKLK